MIIPYYPKKPYLEYVDYFYVQEFELQGFKNNKINYYI